MLQVATTSLFKIHGSPKISVIELKLLNSATLRKNDFKEITLKDCVLSRRDGHRFHCDCPTIEGLSLIKSCFELRTGNKSQPL